MSSKVTPLVDIKPYIIVDNEKIYPVEEPTRIGSATDKQKENENQESDIVDRVTISKEAMAKSRWYQSQTGFSSPTSERQKNKSSVPNGSLLIYSPNLKS